MDFLKSLKTKLIIQISILVVISTLFVLLFVNLISQQHPGQNGPTQVTVDFSLSPSEQREAIQKQIQQNILQERAESAARLLAASLIGIFFQVIFTSAGIYILIKKELKPIEDLNKTMQDINEKLLYLQIDPDEETSHEIAQLINNFNLMMGRLDKAFKAQKQFVENVSHEIKTPLTVVRTNLESIIIDPDITLVDRDSAIKSAIESITFLNKLVEDLLLLSFIDRKEVKLEEIDLSEILNSSVKEAEVIAKDSGIKIIQKVEGDNSLRIKANDILLKRAISNLLENAVKYSKKKSTIEANLIYKDKFARLSISNQGDEIHDDFKTKIFERFFRIDKSRARSTGGFGLGLAITKEIIETFDGKISLESKEGINTFTITLPSCSNFAIVV